MLALKILIIDPIHHLAIERLSARFEVHYEPKITRTELLDKVMAYSAIVVRSGHKIDFELIERAKKLRLVARAGMGIDNISTQALDRKDIKWFNIPDISAEAVSELSIAFIFALSRNLIQSNNLLKSNIWKKEGNYGFQIYGKTLGVIGFGNIGKKVATKAIALGMKVMASVNTVTQEKTEAAKKLGALIVSSEKIFHEADYVLIAVPLSPETEGIVNKNVINKMKPSAFLINVSRGAVVNEDDLYIALKNNVIKGAATDVLTNEKKKSPLFELDNMICTPHIGAMTVEAQESIANFLVDKIQAILV